MNEAIKFFTTFKTIKLFCQFNQYGETNLLRYFVFKVQNDFLLAIEVNDFETGETKFEFKKATKQSIVELNKNGCFLFDVQIINSFDESENEECILFDKLAIYNNRIEFLQSIPLIKIDEKELNSKLIS